MAARNPQFRINLTRIFNKALAQSSRQERDQLRAVLNKTAFRKSFGNAVIERIVERTLSGKDRDGINFEKYSDSYKKSDIFKIYGKSARVNLELTGEMLSSMKAVKSSQEIVIEMVDKKNKDKASGHVYGIKRKNRGKVVRNFLGLPENELQDIMAESIMIYQNESFNTAAELFKGSEPITLSGQVGNQPGFDVTSNFNNALFELGRVLREAEND